MYREIKIHKIEFEFSIFFSVMQACFAEHNENKKES